MVPGNIRPLHHARIYFALIAVLSMAVSLAAQTAPPDQPDNPGEPAVSLTRPRIHGQLMNRNAQGEKGFNLPTCKPAGLQYNGGPVVSNVIVVPVFWSAHVDAQVQQKMPLFLADIVKSDYLLQLSEYATDTPSVVDRTMTKQSVGAGSATPGIVINPLKCNTSAACSLVDTDIQNEISRQIGLHVLPAPTLSYDGQVQTLYILYFPPSFSVTAGDGSGMCDSWCGIHEDGTYPLTGSNKKPMTYAMIGDGITGSCNTGCGNSTDPIQRMASTTWHELAEAITDPVSNPLTWYDNNNNCGEIGDLCDNGSSYLVSVNGRKWGIQSLWSNKLNACTVGGVLPTLKLTAPVSATAASPFKMHMVVVNPSAGRSNDRAFAGTIMFASSDDTARLPRPFTFKPGGTGTVSLTAILNTGGLQTVAATDKIPSIKSRVTVNIDDSVFVDVSTLPSGLSFSVDGVSFNAAHTFKWHNGETHNLSTPPTQFASAGVRNIFTLWSDGGPQIHTIRIDPSHTSFTAVFATSYLLTTSSIPAGSGAISPPGGQYYAAGTVVSLAAVPKNSARYAFSGWSVDTGGAYPAATIIMDAPHTVTARFLPQGNALPVPKLTSSVDHAGGPARQ